MIAHHNANILYGHQMFNTIEQIAQTTGAIGMGKILGRSKIGKDCYIAENVVIGHPGKDEKDLLVSGRENEVEGAVIGNNCTLIDYGIIYSMVKLGDNVQTGHHYLVREHTTIGNGSLVGTGVTIDDRCTIGNKVSIQTGVYIPTGTVIEDNVFLGPRAVLTNDKYMGRTEEWFSPVTIKKGARLGANCVVLPGVTIGEDAVIGSGAVVTKDVPAFAIVVGNPGKIIGEVPMKHRLRE
jgi:acetyltransferase-like isoleucine patch superfamily enzyme